MSGGFLEQFAFPCRSLRGHTENKISKCAIKAKEKKKVKKNLSIFMGNEREAEEKLIESKNQVLIPERS